MAFVFDDEPRGGQVSGGSKLSPTPSTFVFDDPQTDEEKFAKFNKDLEDQALVGQRAFQGSMDLGQKSRDYEDLNKSLEDQALVGQRAMDESLALGDSSRQYDEQHPTLLRDVTQRIKSKAQVATHLLTGALSFPIGLVAGAGEAIKGKGSEGFQTGQQRVAEHFTPNPEVIGDLTPEAEGTLGAVGKVTGALAKAGGAVTAAIGGEGWRKFGEVLGDLSMIGLPIALKGVAVKYVGKGLKENLSTLIREHNKLGMTPEDSALMAEGLINQAHGKMVERAGRPLDLWEQWKAKRGFARMGEELKAAREGGPSEPFNPEFSGEVAGPKRITGRMDAYTPEAEPAGNVVGPLEPFSPEIAGEVQRAGRPALPEPIDPTLTRGEFPGRFPGPAERFSPDLAGGIRRVRQLPALPEAQGFDLVGKPYGPPPPTISGMRSAQSAQGSFIFDDGMPDKAVGASRTGDLPPAATTTPALPPAPGLPPSAGPGISPEVGAKPLIPAPSMTPPPASGAPGAALPSPGPAPMAGGGSPPPAPGQPPTDRPMAEDEVFKFPNAQAAGDYITARRMQKDDTIFEQIVDSKTGEVVVRNNNFLRRDPIARKLPPEPPVTPNTNPTGKAVIQNTSEFPVLRVPTNKIETNPKELQFKLDVNASGEQKPLQGEWNDLASGNLLLWQDKSGKFFVANGHHRLAHAKRLGVPEVNAQVLKEADGFSVIDARRIAAESNILEGKGTIYDQAEYFRTQPEYTPDLARKRGVETKGYAIGKLATGNTYDLFRDRKIKPDVAAEISTAAPGNESLQAVGIKFALGHPKADPGEVTHFIKAIELQRAPQAKGEQVDLFGFDDAAIRSAEQAAKKATKIIKDLREDLNAISGASRRPARAKKLGVDVSNPAEVIARADQLKAEIGAWEKWYNDPAKIALVEGSGGMTVKEPRWEFGGRIPFGAVEVVQPGDIKRAKPDKTAQGSLFGSGDPYKEATEKHRIQFEKFNKTREDYRARRIGDDEFLAAKKEFDAAQQELDKAESLEKKRPAEPKKKVEQVGMFDQPKAEPPKVEPKREPFPEPPKKTAGIPEDPKWAVPGSGRPVKGEMVWENRFSRGAYGTIDGPMEKSPERAVEALAEKKAKSEEFKLDTEKIAAATKKVSAGNYTDEDIKALTGRGLNSSTAGTESVLRGLGLNSTEARKVIKSIFEVGSTSNGTILYSVREAIEAARKKGYFSPKPTPEFGKTEKPVEKPNEQLALIEKGEKQLTLFETTKEFKAIPDKEKMVPQGDVWKWEASHYFKDHEKLASSRTKPMPPYPWKEGDWTIDKDVDLPYGHQVEKLVRLPVKDLVLTEEDYTKSNQGGRGDDARLYAGWIKEGKEPPPISVVETDSGKMSVSNGHRRVAAAKLAGQETILAWVSPRMEVGKAYGGGPIYVGMTYEGATLGPKEAEKQREARRADSAGKDLKAEAEALGVTYKGPWKSGGKILFENFTDNLTHGDFVVKPGESIRDALLKMRKPFVEAGNIPASALNLAEPKKEYGADRYYVKKEKYSELRGEHGPFHDVWRIYDRKTGEKASGVDYSSEERSGSVVKKMNQAKAEPVKNLAIVHNMSTDNLRHTLKLGGLPVPSTAVVNVNYPSLDKFGEITLIAHPDRLGPDAGKENKYFDADIYSPRYPKAKYHLKGNSSKYLIDWLKAVEGEIPPGREGRYFPGPYVIESNVADVGLSLALKSDEPLVAYAYLQEIGKVPKETTNSYEGRGLISAAIKEAGHDNFEKWVDDKTQKLRIETEGKIWSGMDRNGNSKWRAETLDLVVRMLKKDLKDGEGFNYGVPSIRASVAKRFRTLKQIQADRDRIISKQDMDKIKDETEQEFVDLAGQATDLLKHKRGFGDLDTFSEHLKEAIQTRNFWKVFGDKSEYYNPGVDIDGLRSFVNKLRNMPTGYFEGKIQRAVGLHEFDRAVVPHDTPADLVAGLKAKGLEVETYKRGDEQARSAAVKKSAEKGGVLFEPQKEYKASGPIWFSKMVEVIERKLPNAGTKETYLEAIRSWSGQALSWPTKNFVGPVHPTLSEFTKNELKWSGLEEWLAEQKGKITKAEVLVFLKANQVEVKEVVKQRQPLTVPEQLRYGHFLNNSHKPWSEKDHAEYNALKKKALAGQTKFEQYVLPGGENYREIVLSLPVETKPMEQSFKRWNEIRVSWDEKPGTIEEYNKGVPAVAFKSSHFDEPNTFAHVRVNDRTNDKGEKVLFLEEVQSDWALEGRKKGYGTNELPPTLRVARTRKEKMPNGETRYFVESEGGTILGVSDTEERAGDIAAATIEREMRDYRRKTPPFPFAQNWHEVAIKRMLRYAAENGYDRLAWINGEETAKRYDLSKHFKEVAYHKYKTSPTPGVDAGTYHIEGTLINGEIHNFGTFSAEDLPNAVGKEMADRILSGEGRESTSRMIMGGVRGAKILSGLDLKIGGKWAFNLYDKMVPEFLKKYGKKFGAGVEPADLYVKDDVWHVWDAKGEPVAYRGEGFATINFPTKGDAATAAHENKGTYSHAQGEVDKDFQSVPITSAMRSEVMTKGQALFERHKEYAAIRAELLKQRNHQYDWLSPIDLKIAVEALAELRKVEALPIKGQGATAKTIGKAISTELIHKGRIDFEGREVKDIREMVGLFQIFRNPKFETSRWIFVKDLPNGKMKIMGHYGTTSKLPGETRIFKSEDGGRNRYELERRKERMGADGYYSTHNHPSGIIKDSPEDRNATGSLYGVDQNGKAIAPGFRGMIIIDHEKYGFMTHGLKRGQLNYTAEDISTGKEDPFLRAEIDHNFLGTTVISPNDLAGVAVRLNHEKNFSTVLFLSTSLAIRGIHDVHDSVIKRGDFSGYLRNRAREFGSSRAVIVTENKDLSGRLVDLFKKHILLEFNLVSKDGIFSAANELGRPDPNPDLWMGKKGRVSTVASPAVAYGASKAKAYIQKTKELVKYSGDLQEDYYRLRNKSEIDRILTKQYLKAARGTPSDYRAIYSWIEDPKEPITVEQKKLYTDEIEPIRTERNALFSKLRNEGIPVEGEGYVPRFVADRGGFFDRLINGMKTSNAGAGLLRRTAQSFNPRVMKAIVDAQGNRRIVAIKKETVVGFDNGKPELLGKTQRATPKRTEWFDKLVMEKLEALAKDLGISHERILTGKGLRGRRLGVSFPGGIKTKHATPEDVIIHEIGHQIDDRYDINTSFFGGSDKAGIEMRRILKKEIRALADLRYEGQQVSSYYRKYVRKGSEKAAVMFQAYLHAPQAFRSTAPNVYQKFVEFLGRHPETRPILDIKPSLVYGDKTIGGTPDYTKFIDKNGKTWTIGEATTKEIEANTKLKYHKNALLNEIITYNELKKVDRAIEYLENLKTDPEFSKLAIKLGTQNIPDGYKTTVLPQLRGYAFPDRIAETFDTFYKHVSQGIMEPSSAYAQINKFLRNAIFFNPLIHIPNITVHAIVNRGSVALANPVAYPRAVKAGWRAIKATLAMNDDYIAALDQGAGLLYSGVQNQNLYKLMLEKMGSELTANPNLLHKIGRAIGYVNPAHLIKALYKFSSQATWAVNDIATLQAVFEEMGRGVPMDTAVEDTAKHIPNYRIPARVMNSTTISKLMRPDSGITMFGAYHYGALKSYGEMIKSLLGKVPLKERVGAMDKLAMLGIVTLILYPILDEIAQQLTGKKDAKFRRAGAATFPYKTWQLAKGEISFPAWVQSVLTPSIGLSLGMSFYMGRDPRTGRLMPPGEVALNAIAPISQAKRIAEGKTSASAAGESLFGISQGLKKPVRPSTGTTFNKFFGIRSAHKTRTNW